MSPAHSSSIDPEDDLGQTLSRQADRFAERGGTSLELEQVLSRAGEIRRGRRMRASMVMAALVLAIALPVGISVAGTSDPTKPEPNPAITSKPPVKADNSPIALGTITTGAAPKDGYYAHGRLTYRGKSVPLPGAVPANVVRMSDGFLVAQDSGGGDLVASFIGDDGTPSPKTWPTTGSLVVSTSGAMGALVQPDGTVIYIEAGASRYGPMGKIPGAGPFDVDAVLGEGCSGRGEGDGCLVYLHSSGETRGVWTINAHGVVKAAASGMVEVNDVSSTGLFAGQTSVTDNGGCSEVRDGAEGKALWPVECQYLFDAFSPDGRYLLAHSPGDGAGPTDLVILDARTGSSVLRLQAAPDNFLSELTWEDSTHVLASVYDHGSFAVERFGLNGARYYATEVVHDTDDSQVSPLKLG
jgi:hypothetical protein